MDFNIGDRVKYVSGIYGDEVDNPLWGGKFGNIGGTVRDLDGIWVYVLWDNGEVDCYHKYENHLELLEGKPIHSPSATKFKVKDRVKHIGEVFPDDRPREGTVRDVNDEWVQVDWDHGLIVCYRTNILENNIELLKEADCEKNEKDLALCEVKETLGRIMSGLKWRNDGF
jgi:hypothetical protein